MRSKLSRRIKTIQDLLISDTNAHLVDILHRKNPDGVILVWQNRQGNTEITTGILDASLIIAMLEISKSKVLSNLLEAEDGEGPLADASK